MPYNKTSDLPGSVKDNLPERAQEIYQAAYSSTWEQYDKPEERRGDATCKETVHRIACLGRSKRKIMKNAASNGRQKHSRQLRETRIATWYLVKIEPFH